MGNLVPSQMFDHSLVVVKANGDYLHRLDFKAEPAASQALEAGSVCSLNSSGKLVAGVAAGAAGNKPMPMFALQGVNSFDANSDVGNMSGGVMSALVGIGAFEVATTEYKTGSGITYAPNDLLTASGLTTDLGKVIKAAGVYSTEPIVGCVSKGTSTNRDGKGVLSFWTMFLPAANA